MHSDSPSYDRIGVSRFTTAQKPPYSCKLIYSQLLTRTPVILPAAACWQPAAPRQTPTSTPDHVALLTLARTARTMQQHNSCERLRTNVSPTQRMTRESGHGIL